MSKAALKEASPSVERPRMDAVLVCVGFDLAFGLSSQIASSKSQPSFAQGFAFRNPAKTA